MRKAITTLLAAALMLSAAVLIGGAGVSAETAVPIPFGEIAINTDWGAFGSDIREVAPVGGGGKSIVFPLVNPDDNNLVFGKKLDTPIDVSGADTLSFWWYVGGDAELDAFTSLTQRGVDICSGGKLDDTNKLQLVLDTVSDDLIVGWNKISAKVSAIAVRGSGANLEALDYMRFVFVGFPDHATRQHFRFGINSVQFETTGQTEALKVTAESLSFSAATTLVSTASTDGWPATPSLTASHKGEADKAVKFSVNETILGRGVPVFNATELGYKNPTLSLWLYINDVTTFRTLGDGQVELSSGGTNDVEEINMHLTRYKNSLVSGWNHLMIRFNNPLNQANINFFRVYAAGLNSGVYLAISDVQVVDSTLLDSAAVAAVKADPVVEPERFSPEAVTAYVGEDTAIRHYYQGAATPTYASDDETVVTVNESGVMTGVAAGTATITMTAGEKTNDIAVTVKAAMVLDDGQFSINAAAEDVLPFWSNELYFAPEGNLGGRSLPLFQHSAGHSENWFDLGFDDRQQMIANPDEPGFDISNLANPALTFEVYIDNASLVNTFNFEVSVISGFRRTVSGDAAADAVYSSGNGLTKWMLNNMTFTDGWNKVVLPLADASIQNADLSDITTFVLRRVATSTYIAVFKPGFFSSDAASVTATEARNTTPVTIEAAEFVYTSQPGVARAVELAAAPASNKKSFFMPLNGDNRDNYLTGVDLDLSVLDGVNLSAVTLEVWAYFSDPSKLVSLSSGAAGFVLYNGNENYEVGAGAQAAYLWFFEGFDNDSRKIEAGWNKLSMPLSRGNNIDRLDFTNVNVLGFNQTGGEACTVIINDVKIVYSGNPADVKGSWTVLETKPSPTAIELEAPEDALFNDAGTGTAYPTLEIDVTGSSDNMVVLWTSSNPEVLEVDLLTGALTAKNEGTAVITAVSGTASANITVTVEGPAFTGISIDEGDTAALASNGTLSLNYTLAAQGASGVTVTWSSASDAVQVLANGTVTPLKNGTAVIVVTGTKGNTVFTDEITVTVTGFPSFTGLTADVTELTLAEGETHTLAMTPAGESLPSTINYVYLTGDSEVATVEGGVVTAVAAGTTEITVRATVAGVTKEVVISVTVTGENGGGDEKPKNCNRASAAASAIPMLLAACAAFIKKKFA